MKRRRCLETLTAALLAVTMIGGGFALAAPPEGKGHNKGNDGGTTEPPPVTYMIHFLPAGFHGHRTNNQSDIAGSVETVTEDGSVSALEAAIIQNGTIYRLNDLIANLTGDRSWDVNAVYDISDHRTVGNVGEESTIMYVVGNAIRAEGKRAYRLTLTLGGEWPVATEVLDLGVLDAGDSSSVAVSVTSFGEVVGRSYPAPGELAKLFYYNDEAGMFQIAPELRSGQGANLSIGDSGAAVGEYIDAETGVGQYFYWAAGEVVRTWGAETSVVAVNNFGVAAGTRREEVAGKGKKTETIMTPFLFDGEQFIDMIEL